VALGSVFASMPVSGYCLSEVLSLIISKRNEPDTIQQGEEGRRAL